MLRREGARRTREAATPSAKPRAVLQAASTSRTIEARLQLTGAGAAGLALARGLCRDRDPMWMKIAFTGNVLPSAPPPLLPLFHGAESNTPSTASVEATNLQELPTCESE